MAKGIRDKYMAKHARYGVMVEAIVSIPLNTVDETSTQQKTAVCPCGLPLQMHEDFCCAVVPKPVVSHPLDC